MCTLGLAAFQKLCGDRGGSNSWALQGFLWVLPSSLTLRTAKTDGDKHLSIWGVFALDKSWLSRSVIKLGLRHTPTHEDQTGTIFPFFFFLFPCEGTESSATCTCPVTFARESPGASHSCDSWTSETLTTPSTAWTASTSLAASCGSRWVPFLEDEERGV